MTFDRLKAFNNLWLVDPPPYVVLAAAFIDRKPKGHRLLGPADLPASGPAPKPPAVTVADFMSMFPPGAIIKTG